MQPNTFKVADAAGAGLRYHFLNTDHLDRLMNVLLLWWFVPILLREHFNQEVSRALVGRMRVQMLAVTVAVRASGLLRLVYWRLLWSFWSGRRLHICKLYGHTLPE